MKKLLAALLLLSGVGAIAALSDADKKYLLNKQMGPVANKVQLGELVMGGSGAVYVRKSGDTMSGAIVSSSGSVGSPAIGIGAGDTGLYRSSSGRIAFSTAGVFRADLRAFGNGTLINFNGGTDGTLLAAGASASLMRLSGGASTTDGPQVLLYGSTHATRAGDLAIHTGGAEKVKITSTGTASFTGAFAAAPTAVSLTEDDQAVTVTGSSYIRLTSDNGTATNRTFTIGSGASDGQVLRMCLTTQQAELADSGNVALSSVWTADADDCISLLWDATSTKWREVGRSSN